MKRFCVICGKELNIVLGKPIASGLEIVSGGHFYISSKTKQKLNPQTIDEQTEHWECEECNND